MIVAVNQDAVAKGNAVNAPPESLSESASFASTARLLARSSGRRGRLPSRIQTEQLLAKAEPTALSHHNGERFGLEFRVFSVGSPRDAVRAYGAPNLVAGFERIGDSWSRANAKAHAPQNLSESPPAGVTFEETQPWPVS